MKAERMPAKREIKAELAQLQRATEQEIRARAYEIYQDRVEARGDAPGDAMSDWLQAEAELQPEMSVAAMA